MILGRWRYRLAVLVIALLVSACSGGGGGSVAPASTATPAPRGSTAPAGTASVALSFTIPAASPSSKARSPKFIPSTAASIAIDVSSNSTPTAVTQTVLNINATTCPPVAGLLTCAVSVFAPIGNDTFAIAVFAGPNGTGTGLAIAVVPANILANVANNLSATLQAAGGMVAVTFPGLLIAGTPQTGAPVSLIETDAANTAITGTLPQPLTILEDDPSGATILKINGVAANIVTKSTDVITIDYTGLAIVPFNLGVDGPKSHLDLGIINSATTVHPMLSPIQSTNTIADTTSPADPNFGAPTLSFGSPSATPVTIAFSQAGWSAPFGQHFSLLFNVSTCGTASTAVTTLSNVTGTSFTFTPQVAGLCEMIVTGGADQSLIFWVSVAAATPPPVVAAPIVFTNAPPDTVSPSDPNFGQPTVVLTGPNQSVTVNVSQTNSSFRYTIDTSACGSEFNLVALDGLNFTFNSTTSNVPGLCMAVINSDDHVTTAPLWIAYAVTNVTVSGKHRGAK
jgi:hypothetical protein